MTGIDRTPMIVVESGGTKSTWVFRDVAGELMKKVIHGFHPQEINAEKKAFLKSFITSQKIQGGKVYFYGAGCESLQGSEVISDMLKSVELVPETIASDVVGACMAVLGHQSGVAGILGTGAVVAQYDGEKVIDMASGRGFLLGDEGSGFDIGRRITIACLDGEFNETSDIQKVIHDYYGGKNKIVHSCSAPDSRFKIAGLVKHIAPYRKNPVIHDILTNSFEDFVESGIDKLDHKNSVSMVGSIAYHFREELSNVLKSRDVALNKVVVEAAEEIFYFIEDSKGLVR